MKSNIFSSRLYKIALKKQCRICLPEIEDSRVMMASKELREIGIDVIKLDNNRNLKHQEHINHLKSKEFTKNWPDDEVEKFVSKPINIALCMLSLGEIDGVVAGASTPTSEIIRSSIRIIGIESESQWLSSMFFLISPSGKIAYSYADCAVIPEPTPKQLVDIAKKTSDFHQLLSNTTPRVAFLSFSTKGSAQHYRVDKIRDAVNLFSKKYPNINHDGELQFDAAISIDIAKKKVKAPKLKKGANVFIFPNLDAANIAYKITQELAGYSAWGPLLLGLSKPVHDLSRGCSVEDIVNISLITILQS